MDLFRCDLQMYLFSRLRAGKRIHDSGTIDNSLY